VAVRHVAHFIERIHQTLEFLRQLRVHRGDAAPGHGALQGIRQRAVGVAAHGNVIVDIDQFAREAAREKARDEQRHIAEALQRAMPRAGAGSFQGIRQHMRQRLDAQAVRRLFIERIGPRKHRQQIYDVLLGLLVDVQMLMFARGVKRVTKKFAQRTYRHQRSRSRRLHMASFFGLTPSYRQRYA